MRKLLVLIAVSLAAALLGPVGSASADNSDNQIFSDCLHSPTGELQHTYSRAALNHALHHIPADVAEYSGCPDAVQKQLRAEQTASHAANSSGGNAHSGTFGTGATDGGGTTGTGGGGSVGGDTGTGGGTSAGGTGATGTAAGGASSGTGALGSPSTAAPATPHTGTQAPVKLANATVVPGTLPSLSSDGTSLPTPLIVFLALLGAGALAVGGTTIGRRVLARRRA